MKKRQPEESSDIRSSTTKSYVLALSLIALLSIAAYAILNKVIAAQSDRAAVINVSGRQRMLSQRLALYTEYYSHAKASEQIDLKEKMRNLVDKFESNHDRLSKSGSDLGEPTQEVRELYFRETEHLDRDTRNFIGAIRTILNAEGTDYEAIERSAEEIRRLQEDLLPKLDRAVQLNQADSETKVVLLRRVHTAILFFTLLLLLIEAIWIFRPMVLSVQRLFATAAEARETAIRATSEKSKFLATVTHEIRTPMTGVLGLAETLLESEKDANRREQLTVLRSLSENLITMVNNILDYSKIEAGKMTVEEIDFTVESLAQDSQKLFESAAARKGITLSTHVDPGLPTMASGDPTRLRQVITNYVGNALKFTPSGGRIDINYRALDLDEKYFVLRIEVRDNGPGIFKSNQQKLFTTFNQGDKSVSRRYGGTGLGLSICKQIADAMGGRVGVESEEGQGALFWFEAKLQRGENMLCLLTDRPAMPTGGWAQGLKVLLVEDNEVTLKILKAQIAKMGFIVQEAKDGVEALKMATAEVFDIVLMDCEMPEMDGFEASAKIRDLELKTGASPMPIFAITAHTADEVRDRCFESGMNSIITKPIRQEALSNLLYERLSHKLSQPA